jgi:mRNA interferase RelE/StbE
MRTSLGISISMPGYQLVYKSSAVKSIKKLPASIQKRLKVKLEYFITSDNPLILAKPLVKPADAQYRYRVGNYRVLFDVEGELIIILLVQHRKDVYR